MTVRVLRRAEHRTMPWANGAGITHEIARHPAGPGADFDWRVSMAEVAGSGPFSALPGIDRVILLLEGTTMTLTIDGDRAELARLEPLRFPGEAVTTCAIPQPSRDLNVMTRRGAAGSVVRVLAADGVSVDNDTGELLVVAADGPVLVTGPAGDRHELTDGDAVHVDDGRVLRLDGGGNAVIVRISAV